MKKVLEQAQVLAEAILESDIYQKMHACELAMNTNEEANKAVMNFMEKRQAVEAILASNDMDKEALTAAGEEMNKAEDALNNIPAVQELQQSRQYFTQMMENVNRILRLVITGETDEGGCSGNCSSCGGCHH